MRTRAIDRWAAKVLLLAATSAVMLELLFRFVVPASDPPASVQLRGEGIMVFDTAWARSGHTTVGRLPTETYHWAINDHGWNSAQEYLPPSERARPLIAVIGDSHVENLKSDVEMSIAAQMQQMLDDSVLVYSFGKADQSLLQDLVVMRYADSLFSPDAFVLVVGGDAVRRSLVPGPMVTYNYLVPVGDSLALAPPAPRVASPMARTLLGSALLRYLRFNAMMDLFPLYRNVTRPVRLTGGLSADEVDSLLPGVRDHILQSMSDLAGERSVLITLNFFVTRYGIYGGRYRWLASGISEPKDSELLLQASGVFRGVRCVDSEEAFRIAHERTGRRFESADGKHLSEEGNRVMAELILRELYESGTLSELGVSGQVYAE